MRRPTMDDVAARAGVSTKSVSRVVNDEPHVSPEVTRRVQAAIEELGYRPDRRARELAAGRPSGRLVGFVQVDAANPFFAAVNRGLEDATAARGLVVLTGSTDADPAREAALVRTLIEHRVDGLVVAAAEGSDDALRREAAHGTPLVCVDRVLADARCDVVVSDNRGPVRQAVAHLVARGHRRLAFLGGNTAVWTAHERLAAFRAAVAAAGVPAGAVTVVLDVDAVDRAARATTALLTRAEPPTALLTGQDRITIGAVTALHAAGAQQDVALIGFDEVPFAEQLQPSLTLIGQDPYQMGRQAGTLLLDRLTAAHPPPARQVVLPAPLHHRASGDIRPR